MNSAPLLFSASIPVPRPTPQSHCRNSPAGGLASPLPSADSCPSAAKHIPSRRSPDYNFSVQGFHATCLPGAAQGPWPPPGPPLSFTLLWEVLREAPPVPTTSLSTFAFLSASKVPPLPLRGTNSSSFESQLIWYLLREVSPDHPI